MTIPGFPLKLTSPAPVTLELAVRFCVPPLKSSVPPAATVNVPPLVPSPTLSAPLSTLTAPELLKNAPVLMVEVVPAPLLVTVPPARLLNVIVPPLLNIRELFCALNVAPDWLLNTLVPVSERMSVVLSQVAVPALLMVWPFRNSVLGPFTFRAPLEAICTVPPPAIVPDVQLSGPFTVRLPVPSRVPVRFTWFVTINGPALMVSVPEMSRLAIVGLEDAIVAALGPGMQALSDAVGMPLGAQLAAVSHVPLATTLKVFVHVIGPAVPVPLNATVWGFPPALWLIVTVPARMPRLVGMNITLITQFAPGASPRPHALFCTYSPVTATPEIAIGPLPIFVNVIVIPALLIPTRVAGNASLATDRFAAGFSLILRIRLKVPSDRKTLLEESTCKSLTNPMPASSASPPSPLKFLLPLPATVVIIPFNADTRRTTRLFTSPINRLLNRSSPTAKG